MHAQEIMILSEAQRLRNEITGRAIKRFGDWLARLSFLRDELAAVSADELTLMARDAGLEPAQLRALVKAGNGAARLADRMIAALDIDSTVLKTLNACTARDLRINCALCATKLRCRRSLAAGTAAAKYREFCPNTATLEALTA